MQVSFLHIKRKSLFLEGIKFTFRAECYTDCHGFVGATVKVAKPVKEYQVGNVARIEGMAFV